MFVEVLLIVMLDFLQNNTLPGTWEIHGWYWYQVLLLSWVGFP